MTMQVVYAPGKVTVSMPWPAGANDPAECDVLDQAVRLLDHAALSPACVFVIDGLVRAAGSRWLERQHMRPSVLGRRASGLG